QPAQPRRDERGALGLADLGGDAERLDGGGVEESGRIGPPPFSREPRASAGRARPRLAAKPTPPGAQTMWVRPCELHSPPPTPLPIPARIASNEEFIPPPQSPQQKEYEARVHAISEQAARRQGLSRRDFLRTGSGMAAALLALNQVYGDCYAVEAAEVENQKAF